MKALSLVALFTAFSCCLCAPTSAQTQVPTSDSWQMPSAEKGRWLQKLQSVAPVAEWTITNRGNDFVVEHNTPVQFSHPAGMNPPPGKHVPNVYYNRPLRLTLRFTPFISQKQWFEREKQNALAEDANEKLLERFQISRFFDTFYIVGEDTTNRLEKYQRESQKLTSYRLPQLHSSDRSVLVSRSWKTIESIDDNVPTGPQCKRTLGDIRRLFTAYQSKGMYIRGVPFSEKMPVIKENPSASMYGDTTWLNLDEEKANHLPFPVPVYNRTPSSPKEQ